MKKFTFFVVLVVACGLVVSNCKKAPKATEETGEPVAEKAVEGGGIAPEVISKGLSEALCKRMTECAPGTLEEAECVTQTVASLTDALKQSPININQEQLDACIAGIQKGTCEEVMGTEPPAGCEFLK